MSPVNRRCHACLAPNLCEAMCRDSVGASVCFAAMGLCACVAERLRPYRAEDMEIRGECIGVSSRWGWGPIASA